MKRRMLLTSVLLAGCSVLPAQPYQQRRDWPLLPRRAEALPPRPNGRTVLLRTMAAAPGLDARGIQFLRPDGSLNTDYYEQWISPPNQAMEEGLRRWLSDSGLFAAVVATGTRVEPGLILETELTTLVVDTKSLIAHASVALLLLEPRGETTRVRLQSTVSGEASATGPDMPAMIAALREAALLCLSNAELAVAGALAARR